jgi:hypothetical protein
MCILPIDSAARLPPFNEGEETVHFTTDLSRVYVFISAPQTRLAVCDHVAKVESGGRVFGGEVGHRAEEEVVRLGDEQVAEGGKGGRGRFMGVRVGVRGRRTLRV